MISPRCLFLAATLASTLLWGQQNPPPPPPAAPDADTFGGNLSLMPTRVVLEGRLRSEEIMLRNAGKGTVTYRILFKEMAMDENGEVQERPRKEGETTAADLIRFSPRQVELRPGEMQTVRVQLRKPEGLPNGEYRSHLLFQAVPPPEPPTPPSTETEKKLSVKVTTVLGISIPIIVRHGDTKGKISLADLRYWQPNRPDVPPVLSMRMIREGNRSLSGDVK
ncbi:MAG: fimbria/pilus periplasmic chaperone, partial [Firmicutes bacterium]|nr:fimbria/pilus periplasmic chaperone [Bacillota bacterium]